MTKKTYLATIVSVFLMITDFTAYGQVIANNSITFIQADSSYIVTRTTDSVWLEKKPFALRYFGRRYDEKKRKFYSAQIAVLENPEDTLMLKIGQNTNAIPYFELGTGIAAGENGYDAIFISNAGHHYLTYENEKEKRVNLISSNNDILELEWKIPAAFYKEKDVQLTDLNLPALYFVIFIDNNLNEVIDNDELKIIKIIFK